MGWEGLPRVDEIRSLGEDDAQVLSEVRAVLVRHGVLGRFGITLLHSHFDLAPDEVLVETVDSRNRTLTTRPMKTEDLEGGTLMPTSFRLDELGGLAAPMQFCWRPKGSNLHET